MFLLFNQFFKNFNLSSFFKSSFKPWHYFIYFYRKMTVQLHLYYIETGIEVIVMKQNIPKSENGIYKILK